ncbi:MAG TPA: RodZ domain-containing protein [Candidatus Limnocylindria bacterium]|jgi:cytoskeletal protein RodZ|nr:RodZ domain-containing protein [Candidatus Limnocylindria bacterium]
MPALGEEFRSAREARGLTLSDVAEQIHIRSVYLNAIENEEWPSIGAPVYVRGFIRTYARFLGLDAETAVSRFNDTVPVERPGTHAPTPTVIERERSGPSVWAVVGGIVALLLVAFVGYEWWQFTQGSQERPVAAAPQGQPTAGPAAAQSPVPTAAPAKPTATPLVRHRLAIELTQRSWLRVNVDGKTQLEGIFPAGTSKTFSGEIADLRVGNAGGVRVSVNGAPPKTLGKDGDVVEQRYPL